MFNIIRMPSKTGFSRWVGKIFWRRKWQPTLIFLPGEFHGWRSLAGYSPWGHKELDTAERLTLSLPKALILLSISNSSVRLVVRFQYKNWGAIGKQREENSKKMEKLRASLVVQWLRLHTPNGGNLGSIPDQGTKSTKDPACWEKKKNPTCHN